MGDRTYVRLTFPKELREQVLEIVPAPDDEWGDDFTETFGFYEVNYGELPELEALQKAGIPYDQEWDAGSNFGPGTQFCRFTDTGELRLSVIHDDEFNPNLGSLLAAIDDHEALRQLILNHKEKVTPLPWDNQVEYGKKHRTLQLISPQTA